MVRLLFLASCLVILVPGILYFIVWSQIKLIPITMIFSYKRMDIYDLFISMLGEITELHFCLPILLPEICDLTITHHGCLNALHIFVFFKLSGTVCGLSVCFPETRPLRLPLRVRLWLQNFTLQNGFLLTGGREPMASTAPISMSRFFCHVKEDLSKFMDVG